MSFCIKKDLVFSLRKSNNTKYYRTKNTRWPQQYFYALYLLTVAFDFIT